MKRGDIRDIQLASRIAEELDLILCSAEDARLSQLAVSRVEPGAGGAHFIAYLALGGAMEQQVVPREINGVLDKAASFLRAELCLALDLKRAPQITFMLEPALG